MRVARSSFAASLAALPLSLVLACGGAKPPEAAAPTSTTEPGVAPGAASAANGTVGPTDPAAVSPGAPTTTTSLPDGGELMGAKLQEKGNASGSTFTVDGGPSNGPHAQEPGRSPKDIQTIIQAHRDEARACYDRAQAQKPDATMKGNLDVTWKIDPTGAVTDVGIDESKSDIHDKDVAECVKGVVKGLHFAVSGKGYETRAHYPFNFNPKGPTPPKH